MMRPRGCSGSRAPAIPLARPDLPSPGPASRIGAMAATQTGHRTSIDAAATAPHGPVRPTMDPARGSLASRPFFHDRVPPQFHSRDMLVKPIDAAPYVRPPRLGVDTGLSLAKMLSRVVPDDPTPGVLRAAAMLAASVGELETTWSAHGKSLPPRGDTRSADRRLDRDWNAVHGRLASWSVLPEDDPKRRTAEALT